MADTWEGALKDATKILGPKAKLPKVPPAIVKARGGDTKGYEAYKKSRDELEKIVLSLQDADAATKNAYTQFSDKIEDDDFGLDPKNKDDAKNIQQAQKILCDYLSDQIQICDTNIKNLRELNKHLDSLSKYKGPSS